MTEIDRQPEAETEYGDHLARSESVWNRWSNWYGMSERDFEPIREELIADLEVSEGDTVLEIGCGPGVNFDLIRNAIGEDGRLLAIDYSPAMVEKATHRVEENGWENVEVIHADATTADLGGPYDAVVATLSLSVMPDIERAVRNVYAGLESGGTIGVLDLQEFQSGPAKALNPLLRRFLRWYANWNTDEHVPQVIADVFGGYDQFSTYMHGTVFTLRAERPRTGEDSFI
ncbi:class I SAM-dependent methyltransferase [Halostagnicola bangensis]